MTDKLNAAVMLNGKGYFFEADKYYRYTYQKGVDIGYPKKIKGNWQKWPDSFTDGIDAAIQINPQKAFFFKGDEYIRHTYGTGMDSGYPKKIKGNWQKWPDSFTDGIDAGVLRSNGKMYFFKGDKYIRHTYGTGMDSGYPKKIKGNWQKWPDSFTDGIDAGLLWTNQKMYFFKSDKYIRHTFGSGCDNGYPKIVGPTNWDGLFGRYSKKRTVWGKITENVTGKGVKGLRVVAMDEDVDVIDSNDFMGDDITDSEGNYLIRYEGKHYDSAPHQYTIWRPDIFIKVMIKNKKGKWVKIKRSETHQDHKEREDLHIDMGVNLGEELSKMTTFSHPGYGFKFINSFDLDTDLFGVWDIGLCGGMSAGALYRYNNGIPIPPDNIPPSQGSVLYNELFERQYESLKGIIDNIYIWQASPDLSNQTDINSLGHRTKGEWPKIKAKIDQGNPVVLVVIHAKGYTDNICKNHQVLAIGYKYHTVKKDLDLFLYDPNEPSKTEKIYVNLGLPRSNLDGNSLPSGRVRGFFVNPNTDSASG